MIPDIEFDINTINRKLVELDVNKSSGSDGIPTKILNLFSDVFVPILLKIYQQSYDTGTVPLKMEMANVIALHKTGSRAQLNN